MLQIINTNYRRICFIGGPSAGKSTMSAELFAYWKRQDGGTVEQVREYVKNWAWEGKQPVGYDQIYLLGKQMYSEDRLLRNNVSTIISDSPLILSYIYSLYSLVNRSNELSSAILNIVKDFDKSYRPLHVIVNRGEKKYDTAGRFQDATSAFYLDSKIENTLKEYYPAKDIIHIDYNDPNAISYVYNYSKSN